MKKIFSLITILMLIAALTLTLAGCEFPNTKEADNAMRYISVKINPEIELIASDDNMVIEINAVNEDAEILLSDTDLTGENVEDAIEQFVDMATEAGYIEEDSEDNEVIIDVIGEDGDQDSDELKVKLMERVRKFFNNNGINGIVSEDTLDRYAEQAAAIGVPMGKLKMILRALELNPELDINELKELPMKDLISILKTEGSHGFGYTVQHEFNKKREALRTKYADLFELEEEIALLQHQLDTFQGDEESKTELQLTLTEKQNEYNALVAEYRAEHQNLISEMQQEKAEIRDMQKQQKREMIQERKNAKQNNNNNGNKGNKGNFKR